MPIKRMTLTQTDKSLIWSSSPFPNLGRSTYEYIKLVSDKPGPVIRFLLGVRSVYAQPINCQVTELTCPGIGRTQSELTLNKW